MRTLILFGRILVSILVAGANAVGSEKATRIVTVALVDTGLDISHPHLKKNIWTNPKEIENGIDDDGNGYVDDIHGWNFAEENSDIADQEGHGTHIAGIIQNAANVAGPQAKVELVVLKYYKSATMPYKYKDSFFKAMQYAIQKNVDIINVSGGGYQFSLEELKLLKEAKAKGIIVVAAAGNKESNCDNRVFYPAAYGLPNVLSAVATDTLGRPLATSNINRNKKNVFLNGSEVYSSLPGNKFGFKSGSSQAAALLTGKILNSFVKIKKSNPADLYRYINTTSF